MAGTPILIFGIWFLAATTIKRLHDRNKSGWWIIAFFVAPALLNGIADALDDSNAEVALLLVSVSLNLWGCCRAVFLKGTSGPNRFGPDPLAPAIPGRMEPARGTRAASWNLFRSVLAHRRGLMLSEGMTDAAFHCP